MGLVWEMLEVTGVGAANGSAPDVWRAKVPGGWLVHTSNGLGAGATFLPDPAHRWGANVLAARQRRGSLSKRRGDENLVDVLNTVDIAEALGVKLTREDLMDAGSSIAILWESQDKRAWRAALDRYEPYVNREDLGRDEKMDRLRLDDVWAMDSQRWHDFLLGEYFPWKYTQKNRLKVITGYFKSYVQKVGMDGLFNIKEQLLSFDGDNVEEGLTIAKQIGGLGVAGASGLLAIMFPKKCGTVDQFVVKALGQVKTLDEVHKVRKMKPTELEIRDGVLLINIMRAKADENNRIFGTKCWTPRKIDKILWAYGHEKPGYFLIVKPPQASP